MPEIYIEGPYLSRIRRPRPSILPRCRDLYCQSSLCYRTEEDFDEGGFDGEGFDREGYDRSGYSERGFDRYGRDEDGYDTNGYNRSGYDREGYDYYGYNEDGYDRFGSHIDDQIRDRDGLHDYDYTPKLVFRGDGAPWFGLEIEITTDDIGDAVSIIDDHAGKLIYCKHDGSVDGLEAVTHPMSYDWAMENFPWEMFPKLRDSGCSIIPQDNGIHIHVSRDGFKDAAHLYRWLKLWYRNPMDIQRIARRTSEHWASFRPDHKRSHKEHVKRGKPSYVRDSDGTLYSRYSAINTTNDATLELRVFASSLRPERVRAALQLAAASVEYTRHLTCQDIAARRGWEWKVFMAWVKDSGRYPDLVHEDATRRGVSSRGIRD